MDGILLVDKPEGWTSHDVVAKVRSIIRAKTGLKIKVGHTGTLDPMASGLLILVIGKFTKRAGEFSKLDKVYKAEITLGAISTTGDREGSLTKKSSHQPAPAEIEPALNKFVGLISQIPPAFSAVKVDGQRAYRAARAGKSIKIEPRQVKIYEITEVKYSYPRLEFTTKVSSGTYIRSLAEDIGEELGTGAYLSTLRRTKVGDYAVERAKVIDKINLNDIIS
ncbi:MAG TPA: tRNA pseudouridine(55) synthase TruB [Candidatus Saccharimonadales bacterium]|nr:tRNA pseudouridine(55) synthase TruB [Candidatus Saccharimonadales bacterium]